MTKSDRHKAFKARKALILGMLKKGFTYTEIGQSLGISKQRVAQILPRKEWKGKG